MTFEIDSKFFKHEHALCETQSVGPRTRIYAFTHILPGATLGADCNICDSVFIEDDVSVGDRVTVKCGVQLWNGVTIEDDVFIGPNATFTNDPFPRSKVYPATAVRTIVRKGASIGANATILPGLEIGAGALVGAGAVVTRSVPPYAIVVGNPARIVGYVDAQPRPEEAMSIRPRPGGHTVRSLPTGVHNVKVYQFPYIEDMRGKLTVAEFADDLPFTPKRCFLVFGVPSRQVRGQHAHRSCHELLICVHGACTAMVDDGMNRREFLLNNPTVGLHVPPMIWTTQYNYSADAVLLVLTSEPYDSADYIRDYQEFRRQLGLLQKPNSLDAP